MDPAIIIFLLSILALIIASAFFSGSETALTASSLAKIHKLKQEGNKRAKIVSHLIDRKELLIGTILLGNNAINILASALATSLAIKLYGSSGVFFATIIMTLLLLVFAEVLPKTFAFKNAEKFALFVAPPFTLIVKILYPITYFVQKVVNLFLKLFRLDNEQDIISSTDALKGAIDLHHFQGEVIKREKDMLGSILDLPSVEVADVMIHRKDIFAIDIDLSIAEIIDKALETKHSRIPVYKDNIDNIIGVLNIKDLLGEMRKYKDINDIDIKSLISQPWFIPETTTLSHQLYEFRKKRVHFAIAVNEYGDIKGIITLEDILEEIVGQIEDEHDNIFDGIKKYGKNYFINGNVNIRDINRQIDISLPEDAATIAGLIIHHAEKIPEENEVIKIEKFKFEIFKKSKNQIVQVKLSLIN